MKTMEFNLVSPCCHRDIVATTKLEYPLEQCGECGEVECHGECESDCMD